MRNSDEDEGGRCSDEASNGDGDAECLKGDEMMMLVGVKKEKK